MCDYCLHPLLDISEADAVINIVNNLITFHSDHLWFHIMIRGTISSVLILTLHFSKDMLRIISKVALSILFDSVNAVNFIMIVKRNDIFNSDNVKQIHHLGQDWTELTDAWLDTMLWVSSKSAEKVHERAHVWIVGSVFAQDCVLKLLQQSLQNCDDHHWSRYITFVLSKSDCDCAHRVFYTQLQ